MAVPSDFTIAQLVTQGLRRGGIVNPAAAQITESTDYHFREVLKNIHALTGGLPELVGTGVDTCVVGQTDYPWPTDAQAIRSVTLLDAPDAWRGTATAGASTTLTAAADLVEADTTVFKGKYITITGGTGVDQIRQIITWVNATKVVTVSTAWTINPASGSTYAIANDHCKLWDESKPFRHDLQAAPYGLGYPRYGSMLGRNIWLSQAPDRAYILWWDYWYDLDRIDHAGTNFLRFIRDHADLIVEGVAAKVMDRYDDDRATNQLAKYNGLLANLAGGNAVVSQVRFTDV